MSFLENWFVSFRWSSDGNVSAVNPAPQTLAYTCIHLKSVWTCVWETGKSKCTAKGGGELRTEAWPRYRECRVFLQLSWLAKAQWMCSQLRKKLMTSTLVILTYRVCNLLQYMQGPRQHYIRWPPTSLTINMTENFSAPILLTDPPHHRKACCLLYKQSSRNNIHLSIKFIFLLQI